MRTPRPYRVADYQCREQAFAHMIVLNQQWWDELHALDEARRVIEQLLEATAPPPASRGHPSLWTWLKLVFRPHDSCRLGRRS